jgi:hypothetical protein
MRSSSLPAFRPRRALAVVGLASLGAGLLMLTAAAGPAHAAASAGAGAAEASARTAGAGAARVMSPAGHTRTAAKPSRATESRFEAQVKHLAAASRAVVAGRSATVTGPSMYDPATGGTYPPSTVTVTQTSNLVNQQVQVSWTNFTPSSGLVYNPSNVAYPVMVAECKGTNPSSPADCYAAENGGVTSTSGPFGPDNASYATTGQATGQDGGSGLTDIDILTKLYNQFLGCEASHPCSLAIVPSQGGNYSVTPPDCADHSKDFSFGTGYAVGAEAFGAADFSCSWAKRIVVPLTFARTSADCAFRNFAFAMAGSPMAERAVESWVAALCEGAHGTNINYDSTIAEPLALADLGTGQADVALTTLPAAADGVSTGTKHYVYAPLTVSAESIAYWFDNPSTGLPQTGVRLDQRLVLKLLTQSYAYEDDSCQRGVPPPPYGCDNAVDNDALNLFLDPEFTALNPTVVAPVDSGIEVPTVVSGQTDMTWVLTSWIHANKAAASFLAGTYDQYSEHLNSNYLGLTYPTNTLVGQDNYIYMQHEYDPVFPLYAVATDQVENWPPATSIYKDPVTGNYDRLSPELPGQRALIAIVDEGDSAAFLFPSAALPNATCTVTNPARMPAKCNFVEPTKASMLAALKDMTTVNGVKQVNLASTDKDAYPLTMVIYAVVPTSGISHGKAAAIAKFLDYAAGQGQTPGTRPGQLPPGFAPLPASMRAQTRKDAYDVLHQTGASTPSKTTNPGTGSTSPTSSKPAKSSGAVALPTVSPSPSATGNGVSLVNVADAQPASISRYILPALLILGGLAALAGSSSLIGSSSEPISARLRRASQGSMAWGRAARSRLGLRRSK